MTDSATSGVWTSDDMRHLVKWSDRIVSQRPLAGGFAGARRRNPGAPARTATCASVACRIRLRHADQPFADSWRERQRPPMFRRAVDPARLRIDIRAEPCEVARPVSAAHRARVNFSTVNPEHRLAGRLAE